MTVWNKTPGTGRWSSATAAATVAAKTSSTVALLLVLVIALSTTDIASSEQQEIYGTQCSFAITDRSLDGCDPEMLNHRQAFYDNYMNGCNHRYSKRDCTNEEQQRLEMNQRQPQSMVNMTSTGYRKIKAPDALREILAEFWENNKDDKELEDWGDGGIFTNHWEAPTYMVSVENEETIGGGSHLKKAIWDAAINGIAEWTGGVAKLRPVSLYGIREYTEGAVLSPHVDRVPLVSSGIVNVAQDVDEPWPLEVYDRNGHAQNITMEPGDMILYESHSLIHGRPFPLKGRFYANVFIHFEPFDGWDTARDKTHLGDSNGDLPPYILPGSPEVEFYRKENPNGWSKFFAEGDEPPVGEWASEGDLENLQKAGKIDPRLLWFEDENGWEPIHEAVRNGHFDIVKFLVDSGAGINDPAGDDEITPLRIALNELGPDHVISKYLKGLGAEDHGGDYDDDHDIHDEGDDYSGEDEEDDLSGGDEDLDDRQHDVGEGEDEDDAPSASDAGGGLPSYTWESITSDLKNLHSPRFEEAPIIQPPRPLDLKEVVPTIIRIEKAIIEEITPEIVPAFHDDDVQDDDEEL